MHEPPLTQPQAGHRPLHHSPAVPACSASSRYIGNAERNRSCNDNEQHPNHAPNGRTLLRLGSGGAREQGCDQPANSPLKRKRSFFTAGASIVMSTMASECCCGCILVHWVASLRACARMLPRTGVASEPPSVGVANARLFEANGPRGATVRNTTACRVFSRREFSGTGDPARVKGGVAAGWLNMMIAFNN
jgi:hypothetical protein